jgi:hypothetical protein
MIGSSSFDVVILSIIIGTLFAIVYSLRILVMLERRIANMDLNIQRITERVAKEELEILREERKIESKLGIGKKKK